MNHYRGIFWLFFSVFLLLTLSACAITQKVSSDNKVRLIFYNEVNLVSPPYQRASCRYLGTLVSSEGHWYNYLFISNDKLAEGAINDMYNKARAIDANVVYINNNIDFATSVTLLGQAYHCGD